MTADIRRSQTAAGTTDRVATDPAESTAAERVASGSDVAGGDESDAADTGIAADTERRGRRARDRQAPSGGGGFTRVLSEVLRVVRHSCGSGWYPVALLIAAGAVLLGVMIGPAGPVWWRIPLELLDRLPLLSVDSGVTDAEWNLVWNIRLPRVLLAGLVGAMLSVAGASYQGVFRNPLVDPYLLGAAAGAGLGATVIITIGGEAIRSWPFDPVPTAAFACALITVLITYTVGAAFGGLRSSVTLVLAGVAVTSLASAVQTFLMQRNTDVLRDVYSWILGSLNKATWGDVRLMLPYVAVASIVLMLHRRHLDLLRVGDDEATTLGTNVARVRLVIVIAATLGTAAAVAVSGLIGFVGIVVPHLVRLITGASYRTVLPLSIIFGAAFLVLADIPGRMLTEPNETPIGVVTAFLGAPFFLVVLRTRQVVK